MALRSATRSVVPFLFAVALAAACSTEPDADADAALVDGSNGGAGSDVPGGADVPDGADESDAEGADGDEGAEVEPDVGPELDAALRSRLDALLEAAPGRTGAPGVSIRVWSATLGEYDGAAGLASVRDGVPITPFDRLRIGSITKTFCAALTLLLAREGLVSLDDRVDDWVPGFDFGEGVTVETLLTHQSGIFNYTDDAAFVPRAATPAEPLEVVRFAEEHGRVHEPGEAYAYTNTGYFLLGVIIEAATGQRFHEVLRERILDPNGLSDTFSQPAEADAAFVRGHTLGNEATDLVHMSWAWAAGGMISTGRDLCRWIDRVASGLVVGADTEAMLAPARLRDGTATSYGYGIRHARRGGQAVIGHTGSTMGFRGELFFEPVSRTCVAILTNDFFAEPDRFADAVWEAVLGEP